MRYVEQSPGKVPSPHLEDVSSASHGESNFVNVVFDGCFTYIEWMTTVNQNTTCEVSTCQHLLVGRSTLRFKDVCKTYLKFTGIVTGSWEQLAGDSSGWCHVVQKDITKVGKRQNQLFEIRRQGKKQWIMSDLSTFQLYLSHLQKRLSGKDWPVKPLQTLLAKGQCLSKNGANIILSYKWMTTNMNTSLYAEGLRKDRSS